MHNKNSFKQELEKKQKSFFIIGLFTALGFSLMAFEWATFDINHIPKDELIVEVIDIEPAIKMIEIEKPKTKPQQRVKEKIFDPNKDLVFDKKDDFDSTIVDNPDAKIDTSLAKNDDPVKDLDEKFGGEIEEIFRVVEKMPQFPGGDAKLYEFLGKNIKYPQIDKESGVQGKIYLQFVIEKDGSITDVNIARGISSSCDKEAARVVKKMPRWTPGEQRGNKVRVKYTLPIVFKLQ